MATRKPIALVSGYFQEVNTPTDKLDFAGNTTTDLAEGTNLYYTDARARGSITIPFPHELTGDETHRAAVLALVTRFLDEDSSKGTPRETNFWSRAFVSNSLPDGSMAHIFTA